MSEKDKNIGKKDEQTEQEVKPAELSEKELDKVAGGATFSTSRSNIRGDSGSSGGASTPTGAVTVTPSGGSH
jgi:hypothetical protein